MTAHRTSDVCRVALRLAAAYPKTDLGNPKDALDDLIFIVLSSQTSESNYQGTYLALKTHFPKWDDLASAKVSAIAKVIESGGLSKQKAKHIKRIIEKLIQDWGKPTLAPLQKMHDNEAEQYLKSLPGVGIKTARCVMMYALNRDVFPADVHCLRIMKRLGWLEHENRRASLLADPAQNLIPVHLRRSLHVNLVQHGRSVCTPRKPKCDKCCLNDLCKTQRKRRRRPKVVDLCCGGGGFSWGFQQAGFEILAGIDMCPQSLSTFSVNIPGGKALKLDITATDVVSQIRLQIGPKRPDVVIAGPPCQGFSRAGPRKPDDPRNKVLAAAVRAAVRLRPKVIVVENVLNLRGPAFVRHLRTAMGVVRRAGYRFDYVVLNSEAFGVPQSRQRIVFIAFRSESRKPLLRLMRSLSSRVPVKGLTVRAAFAGLSAIGSAARGVSNHEPMLHSPKVIAKIRKIKPGQGPFSYRKLELAKPARTLVCGHRALPCHPTRPRTITVREAARLQAFWDDFRFLGSKSCQMTQVANAVPPKLALAVGRAVLEMLNCHSAAIPKSLLDNVLNRSGFYPSARRIGEETD
jgi:DNA (cytosine-5)-methyltransferase 1